MLFRLTFVAVVAGSTLFACSSGPSKEAIDKAEQGVFAVHDSVMGQIGTVLKLSKQLRLQNDSLDKLRMTDASATVRINEEQAQIRQLTRRLNEADSLMNDWMAGYQGDTLQKLTPDQALGYLNQQQTKINDVKQKFTSSIEQSQVYLKK